MFVSLVSAWRFYLVAFGASQSVIICGPCGFVMIHVY